MELLTRHGRSNQFGFAGLIHPMQGKYVLGEVDTCVENGHDFPFRMS